MRFRPDSSQPAMLEATRLVAAGRPGEATAILQRAIGIASPAPTTERGSPNLLDRLRERFGRATPAPIPEPEHLPEAGEFLSRSYRNASGARAYRLYIPSGYRGEPVPLVVMLHGCTQSPEDFAAGTRMNRHAEERTCLRRIPGAMRERQQLAVLELVSARGPAARLWRAGPHRRDHSAGDERFRGRSGARVHCRAVRRRCRRGDHGDRPMPICMPR